ncbi:MAG: putative Ig domain-containing protein [Acidobacteriia bacterium]|nr:putative Ig domain-containing protein [Terriglobia bacterium]
MNNTASRPRVYEDRLAAEQQAFDSVLDVHAMPPIAHYWSEKFIRPIVEEFGFNLPEELFAKYLAVAAGRCEGPPVFLSLGAGNCDTEVRTAQLLRATGLSDFSIECLELNPRMLERGRDLASQSGVQDNLVFLEDDFNRWQPGKQYTAVIANQVLHHVMELEHLFGEVKRALHPEGFFVTGDMIGRNGHQRWPEALEEVQRFWRELPLEYRWNRLLNRYEEEYINHDCSTEGFEGIRAEEVLPLLLRYFDFHLFVPFSNVIDIFVDRCFGHNFDAEGCWDRAFIDRVQAFDEQAILSGVLTPTHMYAAMTPAPCAEHLYSRGLTPERCVRRNGQAAPGNRLKIVTPVLRPRQPGGTSYSVTLSASGGVPPYTWLAADLPPGLEMSPEGALSGELETDGESTPLFTVRDASRPPQAVAQRYTILEKTRDTALPLGLLLSGELPLGVVGVRYTEALLASGGNPPLAWSLQAGALPRGLSLDSASGVISGEPLATSRSAFTVQVSDASGQSVSKDVELRIESPESVTSRVGVFPHLPCGGGWGSSILMVNPTTQQTSFSIEIRSSGGKRLNWSLDPAPTDCRCHESGHYTLAPYASLRIAVNPHQREDVSAWAEVFSTGPVTGQSTFTYTSTAKTRSEMTIPLERAGRRELAVPFDNQGGHQTGLALLNLSTARPDALVAALWDENGGLTAATTLPLAGGRHTAFMMSERFPDSANRRGIVVVRALSGGPLHAIALRLSADGVFTHLPCVPVPAASPFMA